MEPLEGPPTGDIDLEEVKRKFGGKLCLKGNLNTVALLEDTPSDIEGAVKQAIYDASEGGGFVLSTGDSPGANTPDANVIEMTKSAKRYGRYPIGLP
jgi:uroporphyrinogen decarboxylase